MERHLIHRAVVHWQARQYRFQNWRRFICDSERNIASLVSDLRLCVLNAAPFATDLTGLLLWGGSRLTCIVKTISPCLSSHEDVNTFRFQQATIFTATLLFQPQLITTLYIQLQMIIYKSSVCCFTHMHTDIISYTTYSWDARNL